MKQNIKDTIRQFVSWQYLSVIFEIKTDIVTFEN